MKRLLIVILIAAGLWSGYWFVGAQRVKSGFADWFEARRGEAWAAEYSALSVQGFPNRFDTTFTDLELADPATGWAWQVPFFQILALSYQPNHVIAIWPDQQLVATPTDKYDISSAKMQASVVTGKNSNQALDRANLVADSLQITRRDHDATTMTALHLAVRRDEVQTGLYRFALTADDLAPSSAFRKLVDRSDRLPRTLSAFSADMQVSFDRPWDLSAVENSRPQPRRIDVTLAEAKWGDLELALAGELEIDDRGRPKGRLTVKARNWREILQIAVSSETISQGFADQLESGLAMISGLAGNPKTLDIPLDFRRDLVFLGPLPIGPAPLLRLR
ncbi:hypothetical protein TG4357_01294 [Thalassovita gelatinovora]|uniref:DUF2125 domain-containing protein n=1 Tax=Thalassovita gelatinovora TaxID=53501 RepID=A0A0P1F915_THAGE|nr:DUF2125 domain-containing protein [Thalassovita gelatinovora]CUH64463.1 hypothetical protein TG4357_01294 [Thalassovita gelatinovora]SEP98226.1 hypothetical protein SAMN04488043_102383 [Thalassovita gelatinovora]